MRRCIVWLICSCAFLMVSSTAHARSISINGATASHDIYGNTEYNGYGSVTKDSTDVSIDWTRLIVDGSEQMGSHSISGSGPLTYDWASTYKPGVHQGGGHTVGGKARITDS